MIPLRPTFNSVFANWNEQHKNVFGKYLNTATASQEDVDRQARELEETTLRLQEEWDSLYGDTPEGKIAKENPPPEWVDVYSAWNNLYKEQFGTELVDRPWNADADAVAQKQALDQTYLSELQEYNQRFGTNFAPDNSVLGENVQPNAFFKQPKEKWYKNPLKAALAVATLYFGGQALLGSLGSAGTAAGTAAGTTAGTAGTAATGTAAAGTAAGTGATLGTGLTAGAGGATGLTAGAAGVTGLTAPAGFALAPSVGTSLAAGGAGLSLLDGAATSAMGETGLLADAVGQGLQVPTVPGLSSMGGAQGLTVPITGGTISELGFVPLNATPVLGDPRSFINNPTLLDRPVFTTDSLTMPGQNLPSTPNLRFPNLPGQPPAGMLLGTPGAGGGGPREPLRLYEPIQLQAGLLPLAELYRRPSLLG